MRKKVALVLGSGSSRGWAHIGAIEALLEERIPIDSIAACSVGAYVGAIYASGGMSSLKDFVLRMNGQKVFSYFDIVFPRSGLLDATKRIRELFSMHTKATDFAELALPVSMVATDLQRGDKVVLQSGSLLEALRATMSVPGLFAPARVRNRWLVDGGLVDPVPVGVARAAAADVVIAVDLNGGLVSRRRKPAGLPLASAAPVAPAAAVREAQTGVSSELLRKMVDYYETAELSLKNKIDELLHRESETPDILETVMTSIGIMQDRITRINLAVEPPDVLIQPRLGELKMMDFDQVEHVIEEGYAAVKEKIDDIRVCLEPA